MHTFPGNAVCPSYEALAVLYGRNWYPVYSYEGRDCFVVGSQRISRRAVGRTSYNSYSVHFLDGSMEQVPAGKFNRTARAAITARAAESGGARG